MIFLLARLYVGFRESHGSVMGPVYLPTFIIKISTICVGSIPVSPWIRRDLPFTTPQPPVVSTFNEVLAVPLRRSREALNLPPAPDEVPVPPPTAPVRKEIQADLYREYYWRKSMVGHVGCLGLVDGIKGVLFKSCSIG